MVSSLVDRLSVDHFLLLKVWVASIVVMVIVMVRVGSLRELPTTPISLTDVLLSEFADAARRGLVIIATSPACVGGGVLAATRCSASV